MADLNAASVEAAVRTIAGSEEVWELKWRVSNGVSFKTTKKSIICR